MISRISRFFAGGVFGTKERTGQDVAEYLFFIAVLVGIINAIRGTIQSQFEGQAGKLFGG